MENKLFGKTIIWNGDSICAGGEICGNWATRIGEKNSMKYKNYAVCGGTITDGIWRADKNAVRYSVCATIKQMHDEFPDADYIVIEGGTNDADLIELRGANASFGEVAENDFSGNYDTNTFCGALESVFYNAINYWCGKKICFIIAHKMGVDEAFYNVRRIYFDKAAQICEKWGIPYIDLWKTCTLNPHLSCMYNPGKSSDENRLENIYMYADGQHLTGKGYDYTADIIESWLKTL